MSSTEEQFTVPVKGGTIAGHIQGLGEPVVVLHGGPGLSDYTKPLADELAESFRVFRYQQRGLTPSTTTGPFDVEAHVSDALAVFDGLGLEHPWIAGHSWGGYLALHIAVRASQRVLGILCIDTLGAVGDGGAADMNKNLVDRLSPESRQMLENRTDTEGDEDVDDPLGSLRILWPSYFAHPETAPPMPELRSSHRCNVETFESISAHFEAGTLSNRLPGLSFPPGSVVAAESPIPAEHSYRSAALMPSADVVVLDDCGHFPWIEKSGSILEVLQTMVARQTQ